MIKCRRCHRKLTDPKSVARGYGRTCAGKVEVAVARATAHVAKPMRAKAVALIALGQITPKGTFYTAKAYRTDGRSCTCPAGLHNRVCYHSVAALILDAVKAA